MRLQTKKLLFTALLVAAAAGYAHFQRDDQPQTYQSRTAASHGDQVLADAFRNGSSNVIVESEGRVVRILADDEEGSRHQRFVLRLATGQTVLIAHNVDLAPRIEDLDVGHLVAFRGEYEWNEQGGVVHWTHRDPRGEHLPGWLKHGARTYD